MTGSPSSKRPRLTIRQRLVWGGIGIGALVWLAGGIVIWQVNRLTDAVGVLQQAQQRAAAALEVRRNSADLIAVVSRLLPIEDAAAFESQVTPILDVLRYSNAGLAALTVETAKDDAVYPLMSKVNSTIDGVATIAQTMVRQALDGQWPSAKVRMGLLIRDQQRLASETDELVERARRIAEAAAGQVDLASQAVLLYPALVLGLSLALGAVLTWQTMRRIARPVEQLTRGAMRLAAGHLDERVAIESADELGELAAVFNQMAAELRASQAELERRIDARTAQLRASADVGRASASQLDPNRLMRDVVNLIADRFGYYYAAVFTLDDAGRYAVLREATGEAGRILRERGHKLEVGGQSMVGFVTAQRRPRIALDVGEESARFANPLLPDTRSEIALPLIVGDRVLGALDVQSTQEAAFDEASATVLQGMADQIAIALNNAALYVASQRNVSTLNELLAVSGDIARSRTLPELTGRALARIQTLIGADSYYLGLVDENQSEIRFVMDVHGGVDVSDTPAARPFGHGLAEHVIRTRKALRVSASEAAGIAGFAGVSRVRQGMPRAESRGRRSAAQPGSLAEEAQRGAFLGAPVVVGERVLGVLGVQDTRPDSFFSDDQERLVATLAGQIAVALDNLRLAEETRQALADLDAANRLLTGQAWRQYARTARSLSGEWRAGEWLALSAKSPTEGSGDGEGSSRGPQESAGGLPGRLTIPLRIRGEAVGEFDLLPLGDRERWTPEDVAFAHSLVDQVGQTLETARLLEETERLAGRERLINEINARVRQTVNIDGILQTAVDELGRSLKAARVVARIGAPETPAQEASVHATSPIHETWPRPEQSAADPEKRDGRGDDHA